MKTIDFFYLIITSNYLSRDSKFFIFFNISKIFVQEYIPNHKNSKDESTSKIIILREIKGKSDCS